MTSFTCQKPFAPILQYSTKIDRFTFCAGLGARRLGPGDADAILEGGGRARGSDILNLFGKYAI